MNARGRALAVGLVAALFTNWSSFIPNQPELLLAGHVSNHRHSIAQELSALVPYTAISTYRPESSFTVSLGTNCSQALFKAPVVYQPIWVIVSAAAPNWLEIGTGHQRGTSGYCRYRYWGMFVPGFGWFPLGSEILPGGSGGPTKQIFRKACGVDYCWEFWIGGSKKADVIYNYGGDYVQAGLETYDLAAVAPSHTYGSLQFRIDHTTWLPWSGKDHEFVAAPLCGRWDSATQWRAGENTTC
jgi:hypothetical protein